MKHILTLLVVITFSMMSCGNNTTTTSNTNAVAATVQNIKVKDVAGVHKDHPSVKYLDVRMPAETVLGVVNGALKIDYNGEGFKDKVEKLDKSETYIVYCKSGGRSSKAADIMQQMGFKSIYNLDSEL